jgi:hypothetical protein
MKNIVKILIGFILLSVSPEMFGQPILPYVKATYYHTYQPPLFIKPAGKAKVRNTVGNKAGPKIDLNKKVNDLSAKLDSVMKKYEGVGKAYSMSFPLYNTFNFYTYQTFLTDTVKHYPSSQTYSSVFSNKSDSTHKSPPPPTIPTIDYKQMKTTGFIIAGVGVGCQLTGALIMASYYNSQKITNDVRITKTNLYMRNSITHNMKKSTAIGIASSLGLVGAVCEIWGGIKIGKANVNLTGITIPIPIK